MNNGVDINFLSPVELMTVKVTIFGKEIEALLDSGARTSILKKSVSDNVPMNRDKNQRFKYLKGIGKNTMKTQGDIQTKIKLFGNEFDLKCAVVDNNDMKYGVVLGLDFLKQNKFKIDMAQRKISITHKDGSVSKIFLNKKNEIVFSVREKIPVYCKDKIFLSSGKTEKIPVKFESNVFNLDQVRQSELLYYEGEDSCVETLDGVMNNDPKKAFILGRKFNMKTRSKVKKNEILGYACSILTFENEDESENTGTWDQPKLLQNVKLCDNLTEDEKNRVYSMLLKMKETLSEGDNDIGTANVEPHKIVLNEKQETPIWQKARNFSPPINDEIERQCQELLSEDILEYSNSGYSAPVVPVRKTDGSLRLCIDYRAVNKITRTEKFPMPNLSQCIYKGNNVKYFTKLDLVRGYYQVPIDEESRKYTAFSTVHNHYQFKRLSFGLKNSGMAFQKVMQQILAPILSSNIVVYIDDILIMSETFEQHLELVEKVLNLLMKSGIKIKVKKCEMFKNEVNFLGHVINNEGIRKSPEYVERVKNAKRPENVKQMRQFLGLINFQRKFVSNCSTLTKPLSEQTVGPKGKKIKWTDELNDSFEKLKAEVTKDVMLTYPDYGENANKLELYVDASNTGAGASLMQQKNGEYRVIAYASMCFSETQRRYSTTDRELCAIRWGIQIFRSFLAGVKFIVVTDHKPLVYLNNMSSTNSRLMRTVEELAEFDFEIRYRPGVDNEAADYLSRLNDAANNEVCETKDHKYLPKGLQRLQTVEGGGDSMFESLWISLNDLKENDEYNIEIPNNIKDLRSLLVTELLDKRKEYGLNDNKQNRQKMRQMKLMGQQPVPEVLLAACRLFNLEIFVYHGMESPIVFVDKKDETTKRIYLQCISLIHYNPLCLRRKAGSNEEIEDKYVNICHEVHCDNDVSVNFNDDYESETDFENEDDDLQCDHFTHHIIVANPYNEESKFCALLDTGAQVSLMTMDVFEELKANNKDLVMKPSENKTIKGIGGIKEQVLGCVEIGFSIKGHRMKSVPFGIVNTKSLPMCLLIGANFLDINDLELDFEKGMIVMNTMTSKEKYLVNNFFEDDDEYEDFDTIGFLGSILANQTTDDEEMELIPKYVIPTSELCAMQSGNYAIKTLRSKISKNIKPKFWNCKALDQFKRSSGELTIRDGLLVKGNKPNAPVVVSLPFMVEIVQKTHIKLNHVGRHKMYNVIRDHFWHPGLDGLCRDFCKSCEHCQLFKASNQEKLPPMRKIKSKYPFDLVAVDLLQFEKTRRGNVALLVFVDLNSKWLSAVPIKDKKSSTVAETLSKKILPFVPKIPERLLSDNGPEFRGSMFEDTLKGLNIDHVYSSPYHAPGNGACERVNRTIIQLLRGEEDEDNWDNNISKIVINYNNTVHSQINQSPSEYIMKKIHDTKARFPIDEEMVDNWREGHPNFCSFKLNQKVCKKIQRVGNQLVHKLGKKYEGPFTVTKVQSNGLSYEITDSDDVVMKVNHRFLKPWHDIPKYIGKFLLEVNSNEDREPSTVPKIPTIYTRSTRILSEDSDLDSNNSGTEVDQTQGAMTKNKAKNDGRQLLNMAPPTTSAGYNNEEDAIESASRIGRKTGTKKRLSKSQRDALSHREPSYNNIRGEYSMDDVRKNNDRDCVNRMSGNDRELITRRDQLTNLQGMNVDNVRFINHDQRINEPIMNAERVRVVNQTQQVSLQGMNVDSDDITNDNLNMNENSVRSKKKSLVRENVRDLVCIDNFSYSETSRYESMYETADNDSVFVEGQKGREGWITSIPVSGETKPMGAWGCDNNEVRGLGLKGGATLTPGSEATEYNDRSPASSVSNGEDENEFRKFILLADDNDKTIKAMDQSLSACDQVLELAISIVDDINVIVENTKGHIHDESGMEKSPTQKVMGSTPLRKEASALLQFPGDVSSIGNDFSGFEGKEMVTNESTRVSMGKVSVNEIQQDGNPQEPSEMLNVSPRESSGSSEKSIKVSSNNMDINEDQQKVSLQETSEMCNVSPREFSGFSVSNDLSSKVSKLTNVLCEMKQLVDSNKKRIKENRQKVKERLVQPRHQNRYNLRSKGKVDCLNEIINEVDDTVSPLKNDFPNTRSRLRSAVRNIN